MKQTLDLSTVTLARLEELRQQEMLDSIFWLKEQFEPSTILQTVKIDLEANLRRDVLCAELVKPTLKAKLEVK